MPDDRRDLLCLDLEKAERLRLERLETDLAVHLAAQAKALSNPTRLIIAASRRDGKMVLYRLTEPGCALLAAAAAGTEPVA